MLASVSAALLELVPLANAAGSENSAFTPTAPNAENAALRILVGGNGAPPSHAVPLVSTATVIRLLANDLADVSNATRTPIATTPSPNRRSQRQSDFFWLLIVPGVANTA